MKEGYRVLRYDLMGRGWSKPPPGHWSKPPACCLGGGCIPLEDDPYSMAGHVMQLYNLLRGLNLIEEEEASAAKNCASGSRFRGNAFMDASISSSLFSSVSISTSAAKGTDGDSTHTWPQQPEQQQRPPRPHRQRWQQEPSRAVAYAASSKVLDRAGPAVKPEEEGTAPAVAAAAPTDAVLPVRHVHLVGHSMGGAISVGFADQFPELVASMTLLTPAGLMDRGQFTLLRTLPCCIQKLVQADMRRRVQNGIRRDFLVHGTEVEQRVVDEVGRWWSLTALIVCVCVYVFVLFDTHTDTSFTPQVQFHLKRNPTAHDAFFRSILAFPLFGLDGAVQRVAATKVPVLLVWAALDRILPFDPHYNRWRALLKTSSNVRYEVISDACHGFPLERPERTNQMVLRFLKAPPTFLPTAMLQNLQSHPPTITI